jgi:hypothetical protein
MKTQRLALTLFAALIVAALPQTARANDHAMELATILSGTFVGSTPNNNLKLDFRNITTDPAHQSDLFLTVTGTFEDTNVHQQGLIRLEAQGTGVYFGYVPHFDPATSALSANAGRFTGKEASAACGFSMKGRGDGFAGETLGSQCALAMRGAVKKWKIEIEPGTILVQDPQSGETLRFRRVDVPDKTEKTELAK